MTGLLLGTALAHQLGAGLLDLSADPPSFTPPRPEVALHTDCGAWPELGCTPSQVRVDGLASGEEVLVVTGDAVHGLTRDAPSLDLRVAPAPSWLQRGFTHVLAGLDHVLFVLGLVALVPRRRLLVTVTGFTLGHASSLAAAATGVVSLPVAPIEALIALSVVWLARELVLPSPSTPTTSLAMLFGLLHGLGFAGGLSELGLRELPKALLHFHVGIELAQLLVVVVALPLVARLARPMLGWPLGALAACWTLQRLAALGT